MRRQRVGVDVQQLTVPRGADARDDRHVAARTAGRQQARRAVAHRGADQTKVDSITAT